MLTHNTHYATTDRFVVRYCRKVVQYITPNRRLTLDQSKAKVFDDFFKAERFCWLDINSGCAEIVNVSSL